MALGNYNSTGNYSNNDQKMYNPSVMGIRLNNAESKIDQTAIKFDFWNGMLKISIAGKKPGKANDEFASFDFEQAGVVYITHPKARILLEEIKKLEADPSIGNVGVNTGVDGLFSVSTGAEYGASSYCFSLRKVDNATGAVTTSYVYVTKDDYYQSVRSFDEGSKSFVKENYTNVELEIFKDILQQYILAATSAMAGSVMNALKFDLGIMRNNFKGICDKLGVSTGGKGGSYNSSSNFFNGGGSTGAKPSGIPTTGSYSEYEDFDME